MKRVFAWVYSIKGATEEGSLLKRSLVVTAAMLAFTALWVTTLSLVLLSVVERAVGGDSTPARVAPEAVDRGRAPGLVSPTGVKPNG